jgi:ATP-dependent Clp protease adaptor protein ClpS
MSGDNTTIQEDRQSNLAEKTIEPPMYKVLLHNDDYTTKEFVVDILMVVFGKAMAEATRIMWHVHENGLGLIDIYTLEVAETKVNQVSALAREHGFPLKTTIEKE